MKRTLSYKKHKQHKQQRKTTKKNKNKKHGRHMKGGDFSQEEKEQLLNIGFTNDQLVHLAEIASMNDIQNHYNSLNENITQEDIAELVTYRLLNMDDYSVVSSIHGDDDDNTIAIDDISFSSDDTDDTDANTDNEDNNTVGGKKRISKKSKKSRKSKKTRKQKGGMCYGTGVGANYNNPNYSIHNTELLELFPYKPK